MIIQTRDERDFTLLDLAFGEFRKILKLESPVILPDYHDVTESFKFITIYSTI